MALLIRWSFLMLLICSLPAAAQTQLADSYEVRFELSAPEPPLRLPAAEKHVTLTPAELPSSPGVDPLQGRLLLGPEAEDGGGRLIVVARKARNKPYSLFFIDRDGDGAVGQEEGLSARPKRSRGKIRTQLETAVRTRSPWDGESSWEETPIRLWIEVADRGQTPEVLHAASEGAAIARLDLNGFDYQVVVSDTDLDGGFGSGDLWTLEPVLAASGSGWRRLDDFKRARGAAWKLELDRAQAQGRLVRHDPGIAPSEDAVRRQPKNLDRLAPRAQHPVAFATEVKAAIADATARGLPYFLNFGADWCLPCRRMEQNVYTAEDVVEAARGIVCIEVDGEDHPILERRHKVKGYPTGILFAADGKEIARFRGYRGVAQMAAFFRRAHQ